MPRLKVPSLQHLARNWHQNPDVIKNRLIRLVRKPPTFNYESIFSAVEDLLLLRLPYEQVIEGIRRGTRRADVRDNLLGLLPLVRDYFLDVAPDFYQSIARRYYPAGRGILVPFDSPLIYGVSGTIHFPWFSFWRRNPLASKRLSLFVSLVDEVLLQDPDLENAKFVILDFSASAPKQPRQLHIVDAARIPRLNKESLAEMLSIFAKGYRQAKAELAGEPSTTEKSEAPDEDSVEDQLELFDDDKE